MTATTSEIDAKLNQLGFSLESSIPGGKVDGDWPCIAYDITLRFKDKTVISTQYKLGVGHVEWSKARPDSFAMQWSIDEQSLLYTLERHPRAVLKDKQAHANVAAKLARKQGVKPGLADVMHSLLLDGEPFFNAQSFEDWADEFGYDKDSRKAEATYRECDATGRKLAANVPAETLAKVRELVQDL